MRTFSGELVGHASVGEPPLGVEGGEHGVGGPAEGRDDAVALALLDRSHAVVRHDDLVEELVVPGDGGRHRVGLGLPLARSSARRR